MSSEKQSIYDIFRACRLCGAGGGYKMPIIQNVVSIDAVELRQKIRDCVQIEVNSDDKMPPLICELCIDKVNDFYEFFELCKLTNVKTRKRLGLPLQTTPQGSEEDCILGVTEPVFATHDSDDEPLTRTRPGDRSKSKKSKTKVKETKKVGNIASPLALIAKATSSLAPIPKIKIEPLLPSEVRTPVVEQKPRPKPSTSTPKVEEKSITVKRRQPSTAGPASSKRAKKPEAPKEPPRPPTPPSHSCDICGFSSTSSQGVRTHQRSHVATFTDTKLSCNACNEWFPAADAAASHHRRHKNGNPYHCTHCYGDFDTVTEFNSHFEDIPCKKFEELPDPQCESCWKEFPTRNILKQHRCLGPEGRPGGKCEDCNRTYATLRSLKKHTCSGKKQKPSTVDLAKIDPEMLAKVQPMQIRVAKCDPLLANKIGDHIDISEVYGHYGTDLACYYPYKYYNSYVQPEESFYSALRNTDDQSDSVVKNDDSVAKNDDSVAKNDDSVAKNDDSVAKNDDFGDNEDFTSNIDNIISSLDDSGKGFDFDSLKDGASSKDVGSPVICGLTDSVEGDVDGSTEKVNGNDSKIPENDRKSLVSDSDKPLWTPHNDMGSKEKPSLWTPQKDLSPIKDSVSPKKNESPSKNTESPKKNTESPKKNTKSPKKDEIQTNGSKGMDDKAFMDAPDEQIEESSSKKDMKNQGLDNISDGELNFDT